MFRRTRAAAIARPYRSADMRGVRFAQYYCACQTCDGHIVERAGTKAREGSAMPFAPVVEEAIILCRSHLGGTPTNIPIFISTR